MDVAVEMNSPARVVARRLEESAGGISLSDLIDAAVRDGVGAAEAAEAVRDMLDSGRVQITPDCRYVVRLNSEMELTLQAA